MNEKRRSLTILALALLAWLAPQGAPAPAHGASKGKGKSKSGAPVEEPVHAWARVAPVGGGLVLADSLPAKARKTLQALAAETCGTTAPKLAWARVATRLPHDALLVLFAAAPSEAPDEGSGAAAADLCVAYAAVDGSKPAAAASARLRAGAAAAGDAPSAGRWTLAYERDLDVDGVSDAVLRWVDDASGEAALVLATTSPPALTAVPLRGKGPSPDAHG
ncbi:MAG TPA: hypothetical protein VG389_13930, partial [Myxococcota bacterium]|nr:hypothetical protein [Myxococcota bacterium]